MINREDGPWFVAADVSDVLGYRDTPDALRLVDDDERADTQIVRVSRSGIEQKRTLAIINEPGLYELIISSRKPEARAFKKWVKTEVLPSIRKHGAYIAGQEKVATGEMSREELLARAVKAADSVLAEMEQRALATEQKVVELEPDAAVAQEHFNMGRRFSINRFARTLDGVNSMAIKRDLRTAGYPYRVGSGYRVYSQYRDRLFVEKREDDGAQALQIFCTSAGEKVITKLYREGRPLVRRFRRLPRPGDSAWPFGDAAARPGGQNDCGY